MKQRQYGGRFLKGIISALTRRGRSLLHRQDGVAAVEFALIVPTLIMVWVGMLVATDAMQANKKIDQLARSLADMSSQLSEIEQSSADSIFQATQAILYPKSAEALAIRLTGIAVDSNKIARIEWSLLPSDSNLRGDMIALPRCEVYNAVDMSRFLSNKNNFLVLAEVKLAYTASLATEMVHKLFGTSYENGSFPLYSALVMRPRNVAQIKLNPPQSPCPGATS